MSDTRVVTVFLFDLGSIAEVPMLIEAVAYHTRTGNWPPVPADERQVTINGQANLRSAPLAQPSTLLAPANRSDAKLDVIGPEMNGYTPVRVWVFTPRTSPA